jgi:hypothetical protein
MGQIQESGFDKVTWVCLRDTPIVYVNGESLNPRDRRRLNSPLTFPSLDFKNLPVLDKVLQEKIRKELHATGGILGYWKEAVADKAEDVKNVQLSMYVAQEEQEDEVRVCVCVCV